MAWFRDSQPASRRLYGTAWHSTSSTTAHRAAGAVHLAPFILLYLSSGLLSAAHRRLAFVAILLKGVLRNDHLAVTPPVIS